MQIDLIFTNRPERIVKSFNILTGLSDHNLTVTRKLTKKLFHPCAREQKKITIPKSKYQNIVAAANQIQWDDIFFFLLIMKKKNISKNTGENY